MRPKHVVIDEQIIIAEGLGGLRVILERLYIVTKFYLGKHNAIVHDTTSRNRLLDLKEYREPVHGHVEGVQSKTPLCAVESS
jgi:hypothetical protein